MKGKSERGEGRKYNIMVTFRGKKYRSKGEIPPIEVMYHIIQSLGGLTDAQIDMLILLNEKGPRLDRVKEFVKRTKSSRFKQSKKQNYWALMGMFNAALELRYLDNPEYRPKSLGV